MIIVVLLMVVVCLFMVKGHPWINCILFWATAGLFFSLVYSGMNDYPELLAKKNEISAMERRMSRRISFYDQSALRATIMLTEAEYNFELTKSQYYESNLRTILFADGLFIDKKIQELKLIKKRKRR